MCVRTLVPVQPDLQNLSSYKLWFLRSNSQQAAIFKFIQFMNNFISEKKKNLTNSKMNLIDNFRLDKSKHIDQRAELKGKSSSSPLNCQGLESRQFNYEI